MKKYKFSKRETLIRLIDDLWEASMSSLALDNNIIDCLGYIHAYNTHDGRIRKFLSKKEAYVYRNTKKRRIKNKYFNIIQKRLNNEFKNSMRKHSYR